MSSHERYHPDQTFHQSFDAEETAADYYPATTMASFSYLVTAENNTLPYPFSEAPASTYISAPVEHKMMRTASNGSMQRSLHDIPLLSSTSIGSPTSSTVGSPYPGPAQMVSTSDNFYHTQSFVSGPIIADEAFASEYRYPFAELDNSNLPYANIDPKNLSDNYLTYNSYGNQSAYSQPSHSSAPSPAPSMNNYSNFNHPLDNYNPAKREGSVASQRSGTSPRTSLSGDEDGGEKGRCPHPDCRRTFKDLRAHLLTHEPERPEKCPIVTCEYHKKGFSRKYDKNRHTMTHYRGTMVCGFCAGSGSPAEKLFNRADVFKRHLTSVHGVEQNPPNSRKRSPNNPNKNLTTICQDATGRCSTCSSTFKNAQDFYEHLDDCVLRAVQEEDPSEAINALRLAEVATDPAVKESFERNMISQDDDSLRYRQVEDDDDEEEDEDEYDMEDDEEDESSYNDRSRGGLLMAAKAAGARAVIGGNITKSKSKKRGMTWSQAGVPLRPSVGKSRKRRKDYPLGWGMAADKMKMKKRVLCVYDGSRRLLKDDIMLHKEFEVRVPISATSEDYVTDLDVETLKRAQAYHNATEEEKGEETDLLPSSCLDLPSEWFNQ